MSQFFAKNWSSCLRIEWKIKSSFLCIEISQYTHNTIHKNSWKSVYIHTHTHLLPNPDYFSNWRRPPTPTKRLFENYGPTHRLFIESPTIWLTGRETRPIKNNLWKWRFENLLYFGISKQFSANSEGCWHFLKKLFQHFYHIPRETYAYKKPKNAKKSEKCENFNPTSIFSQFSDFHNTISSCAPVKDTKNLPFLTLFGHFWEVLEL